MTAVYPVLAAVAAYLLGSLSFAVIVTRVMGLSDPRTYGSKNPGATNVLRSGNKVAAVLTLLLDALKGYLPTALVQHYAFELGFEDTTIAFVGVAAFIGHLFPVWLGFKGGKGVATYIGTLLGVAPLMVLVFAVAWLSVAFITRYSSLSALVATLVIPVALWILGVEEATLVTAAMTVITFWRHKQNIERLIAGTESKIGAKG